MKKLIYYLVAFLILFQIGITVRDMIRLEILNESSTMDFVSLIIKATL